ncbi:hypothetical protein HZH66_009261 [Vespula vulgaris]|uniref:Uncharacterized protein n=1 Tax=Vespula vulgaris TaxID=7454 RepID=A0A834JSL2_VESVU|nr:hypothetical protein HZH66_009261 [Vespula vulgaris]
MGWAIQCHRQDGSRFLQNVGIDRLTSQYLRCASNSSFFESEKMLVFVFIARTVKEKEVEAVSRKDRKKGEGEGGEGGEGGGGGGGGWEKDGASNAKGMQEIASPLPLFTSPCLSPSTISTTTSNTTLCPPSTSPYLLPTSNSFLPFPFPQTFLSSVEAKTSSESF